MTDDADSKERINIPDDTSMKLSMQHAECIMETMATADEVRTITEAYDQPFYLFGEDRTKGIHRFDAIPRHWVTEKDNHLSIFKGTARPGEFYVFQIGVYAPDQSIGELSISYTDLTAEDTCISSTRMECLSIDGVDCIGAQFKKKLTVDTGCLQALWIAIPIPADARGTYTGTIAVSAAGSGSQQLDLILEVSGPQATPPL